MQGDSDEEQLHIVTEAAFNPSHTQVDPTAAGRQLECLLNADDTCGRAEQSLLNCLSVITNPTPGETVPTSGYTLARVAWSGEEEIAKIEISTDGGRTQRLVDTLHARTDYSWYRWDYQWTPPAEGKYTLICRASNVNDETQPMELLSPWDSRGYSNNMVFPVDVVGKDSQIELLWVDVSGMQTRHPHRLAWAHPEQETGQSPNTC